jgi:hypothetical protein
MVKKRQPVVNENYYYSLLNLTNLTVLREFSKVRGLLPQWGLHAGKACHPCPDGG